MLIAVQSLLRDVFGSGLVAAAVSPVLIATLVFALTYAYTTLRYRLSLASLKDSKVSVPPPIPYKIPFLGHVFSFLAPYPGQFWKWLVSRHNRETGACSLTLGGQTTNIIFSPSAIQALMKMRTLGHPTFNDEIATKMLGLSLAESHAYFGPGEGPDDTGISPEQAHEKIFNELLLKADAVTELTTEFVQVLRGEFDRTKKQAVESPDGAVETNLNFWIRDCMFVASVTALMGTSLLEVYPELKSDFWRFDTVFLSLFFGIPKIFNQTAHRVRNQVLQGMARWHNHLWEELKTPIADPATVAWEPVLGSRLNRARQLYYERRNLTRFSRGGFDLGLLFGANSNAIPATGWMIMHILAGEDTLLPRVMAEVQQAARPNGTVDIPTLLSQPLLQSIFQETLRLYVDALVTRELNEDIDLPAVDGGARTLHLRKGEVVMVPTWTGHRNSATWTDPPADQFYAERFLRAPEDTKTPTFSLSGTAGRFYPWGGGKTMCPGRIWAKQETLAAVAMMLLAFDVEKLGYVDAAGNGVDHFPTLRQSYSGSGIVAMSGDMKVRMRLREKQM